MRIASDEEIRERLIRLLDQYSAFCKENGLRYYMAFGSALGTVRHQGFIPWDDDIDLCMPDRDYERFLQLCDQGKAPFNVIHYGNNKEHLNYFAKVMDPQTVLKYEYMKNVDGMGLFLDIFPLNEVHLSASGEKYKKKMKNAITFLCLSGLEKFWASANPLKSFAKRFVVFYTKLRGTKHWQENILSIVKEAKKLHETDESQYLFSSVLVPVSVFGAGKEMPFENTTVICPEDYDTYLKTLFGNYMQLPPEDKRVSNHDFTIYVKD